MSDILFTIKTGITKKDYRKLIYIVSFRSKKMLTSFSVYMIILIVMSLLSGDSLEPAQILIMWIFWILFGLGSVCFKIEKECKKVIKKDIKGVFASTNILKFYTNCFTMESAIIDGVSTLNYNMINNVFESKYYIVIYFNEKMAIIIKKADIEDIDKFKSFIKRVQEEVNTAIPK